MNKKFYAVKSGKKTGVFYSWLECKDLVMGYSGAEFKSFESEQEALAYLEETNSDNSINIVQDRLEDMSNVDTSKPYAFVDGSFNPSEKIYGCGGFLCFGDNKIIIQGSGNDPEMAKMRNISGEILGAMLAIDKAIDLGLDELVVYHDYIGIRHWADGSWKRNKEGTELYYKFIQKVKDKISLTFVHVKGHTGVDGNEEADRLAKEAVGLSS